MPIDEEAWEGIKQLKMDGREGHLRARAGPDGRQFHPRENEQRLLDIIGMAVYRKKTRHARIGQLEHIENRLMTLIGG